MRIVRSLSNLIIIDSLNDLTSRPIVHFELKNPRYWNILYDPDQSFVIYDHVKDPFYLIADVRNHLRDFNETSLFLPIYGFAVYFEPVLRIL